MKQNDIAIIVAVVAFAAIFSFVLTSFVILPKGNRDLKVKTVDTITATFDNPGGDNYKDYYNKESLNPTRLIKIEETNNKQPF